MYLNKHPEYYHFQEVDNKEIEKLIWDIMSDVLWKHLSVFSISGLPGQWKSHILDMLTENPEIFWKQIRAVANHSSDKFWNNWAIWFEHTSEMLWRLYALHLQTDLSFETIWTERQWDMLQKSNFRRWYTDLNQSASIVFEHLTWLSRTVIWNIYWSSDEERISWRKLNSISFEERLEWVKRNVVLDWVPSNIVANMASEMVESINWTRVNIKNVLLMPDNCESIQWILARDVIWRWKDLFTWVKFRLAEFPRLYEEYINESLYDNSVIKIKLPKRNFDFEISFIRDTIEWIKRARDLLLEELEKDESMSSEEKSYEQEQIINISEEWLELFEEMLQIKSSNIVLAS